MGKMGKGCITALRKQYMRLNPDEQAKLSAFYIIHPNFYLKTRLLIRSFFQSRLLSRKVHVYETIVSFVEDARRDQGEWGKGKNMVMLESTLKLNKMIIGYMPQDIHQIYLEETEVFKSKLNQLITEGK